MLKQRVITALVLVAVVAGAIFALSVRGFTVFLALVVAIGLWEWAALAGLKAQWSRLLYGALGLSLMGLLGWGAAIWSAEPRAHLIGEVLLFAAGWWVLAILLVSTYPATSSHWAARWQRGLMGVLTLVPAWLAFVYLHAQVSGDWLVVLLIGIVAAADIGAYFVGTRFGRHKLAPSVSPGKSWEGFAGGVVASLLLVLAVWLTVWTRHLPLWQLLIIAVATVLASVFGDLFESMMKRQSGVKDSSNLLPGHGGVLDRLDSLSAAAPIFALGLFLAQ